MSGYIKESAGGHRKYWCWLSLHKEGAVPAQNTSGDTHVKMRAVPQTKEGTHTLIGFPWQRAGLGFRPFHVHIEAPGERNAIVNDDSG